MIGALLKENRQRRNLTQKQLGEKAGISFVAVNRIERGAQPRLSVANKLFNAMDLDLKFQVANRLDVS
jgi:transcriptional regulator with XRE-family HTH domain